MVDEVTPDTLMERFQGKGLKGIILFTIVVHIVVIGGSSVPYLIKKFFGPNTAEMTQEERVKEAVKEATAAIRDIAGDYDLNPQDIGDQFSGGSSRTETVAPAEDDEDAAAADKTETAEAPEPEREKSEYEKDLEVKADGPAVPEIEDDIF